MAKGIAERSALAFLNAEIHTGLTMAHIALRARRPDKKERNRTNARKAYDAILHYLPQSNLSSSEAKEIQSRLAELRSVLQRLGEKVQP